MHAHLELQIKDSYDYLVTFKIYVDNACKVKINNAIKRNNNNIRAQESRTLINR